MLWMFFYVNMFNIELLIGFSISWIICDWSMTPLSVNLLYVLEFSMTLCDWDYVVLYIWNQFGIYHELVKYWHFFFKYFFLETYISK